MPGYYDYCIDIGKCKVGEWMTEYGEYLELEPPYIWDLYTIKGKQFKDVAFYYTNILRGQDYALKYNNYDKKNALGLVSFEKGASGRYVFVVDQPPETIVVVFYKLP